MPPSYSVIITGGNAGLGFETAKIIALATEACGPSHRSLPLAP